MENGLFEVPYPLSIWNVATAAMTKPSLIKRLHILYPPFSSISWYYFMSEYATCYYNRWGLWVWDRARPSEKMLWSHEVTFVTDKILFFMDRSSQAKHLLTVTYALGQMFFLWYHRASLSLMICCCFWNSIALYSR